MCLKLSQQWIVLQQTTQLTIHSLNWFVLVHHPIHHQNNHSSNNQQHPIACISCNNPIDENDQSNNCHDKHMSCLSFYWNVIVWMNENGMCVGFEGRTTTQNIECFDSSSFHTHIQTHKQTHSIHICHCILKESVCLKETLHSLVIFSFDDCDDDWDVCHCV